jgi:acetylornithine deacetylase/succinyl-diaminopimelate desuccinylase-like protein
LVNHAAQRQTEYRDMPDFGPEVTTLAQQMVRIDSRSGLSNLAMAECVEAALGGFTVERLDYTDTAGVAKRALVARKGAGSGGLAFSGHMDTVPATGWQDDPWSGRIDDSVLHGLGSADMKGQVAAAIVAARHLPERVPVTLLITTDEETTKAGAKLVAAQSVLAREAGLSGIVVVEPTGMVPVRGHRSSITFTALARGVQAHSSTGRGRNANWAMAPFLMEMKAIHERLRDDPALHDPGYDPPFGDFNLVIDNHGAPVNMTVPLTTVRIKFRTSASVDPVPIRDAVRAAAARCGVELAELAEGKPPELPASHPLIQLCTAQTGLAAVTVAYGTDASELQEIAPCVVLGPGDIAVAHTPVERIALADLAAAVPVFMRLAETAASA